MFDESCPQLANEIVLPSQFADLYRSKVRDGYTRLWLATLEDALRSLGRRAVTARAIRQQLDDWEWVESEAWHPCSFNFICQGLGIEPRELRGQLWELDERGALPQVRRRGNQGIRAGTKMRVRGQRQRRA